MERSKQLRLITLLFAYSEALINRLIGHPFPSRGGNAFNFTTFPLWEHSRLFLSIESKVSRFHSMAIAQVNMAEVIDLLLCTAKGMSPYNCGGKRKHDIEERDISLLLRHIVKPVTSLIFYQIREVFK